MRIAELLFNRPLMISEAKLNVVLHALGPRFNLDLSALPLQEAAVLSDQDRARSGYYVRDGVAVVGMYGPLLHRVMASDYPSGGPTTYGEIRKAFDTALADDGVQSILLDIDSPGGEVCGVFDLADHIYQSRAMKPITAVCNESAYSAAYLLASSAGRIIIPRTGGAGSVGVVATHADFSRAEDAAGITITHIYAGAKKVDYSPHRPLSSEALTELQAGVAETYDLFVSTVARNRGISESVVRGTEAGCFVGKKAVGIGLADEVAPVDKAIQIARKGVRSTTKMSAVTAATETEEKMDRETLLEKHPDLYQAILAEGKASAAVALETSALAAAREEGAATERQRIQAVESACMPGHEKLIAELKFDGKTTGGEAALSVLAAEKQLRESALSGLQAGANPVVAALPTATGDAGDDCASGSDATVEERAAAEWDKNPALKSEFTSQEAFVAFRRNQEAGRVRILNKR
jgi:signal peptide peptidase SppA